MKTKKAFKRHRRLTIWIKGSAIFLLAYTLRVTCSGQISGSTNESPNTLGKGVFEFAGMFNKLTINDDGYKNSLYQPAIKIGAGLTDNLDFKFAYFRDYNENVKDGFNVYQFIPKVGGTNGRIAFYVPVGLFHSPNKTGNKDEPADLFYFFSPKINGAVIKRDDWDVCLAAYLEIMKEKGYKAGYTGGINIGAGTQNKSRTFSARAELGLDLRMIFENVLLWNVGMTLSYNLKPRSGRGQKISQSYNRYISSLAKLVDIRQGKTLTIGDPGHHSPEKSSASTKSSVHSQLDLGRSVE